MPENFQAEQSKISAVEKKAGEMKEGKKTHEELAAELQAKHDVFFKQVDSTAKTFQEAEKLKDPAAKTELGKDKQEIKDLILKAAQSGENILAKTETGFTTIRQSAERISKLTTTVADNLKFFQDMDTAKELLTGSDSWLKKAQSYEGNGEKPTGWQSEYVVSLDMGLTNLDALSSAILSKYTSFSSPELKAVYDAIKKQADTNMLLLTESRMRFLKNFPDKMNTYIDDEGNEKQVTPEQKATIAKIQSIREKGSINGQKEGAEGYTGMMLLVENGKVQITNAAGEKDEQKKQVFLDSAKDEFTRVKAIATQITPELSSIAEEVKTLPPSFRAIYNIMVNNTASASAEAVVKLGKLEKGRALVSGREVVDEVEKLYDDSSENCAKKKFEAALAERNKLTLDPKYQEKLNNYSKLAGVGELKADPDANEKKDDVLHDRELFKSIDSGLTALCALSGKMQGVDRSTMNREDQVRFDQLKGKIDAQIAELNQIKLGLQSYHLAASIGERYREPGKEAPKYFTFVTKTVNGVQVTAMVPTEEFLKLPKDKQDAISDEFMSLQASSKLDNERKKELPEDKDWKEGMSQFEKGNWQGAKKLLLAYMQRFQADPEKAVQIQSTRGILQGIIQKEMGDVKDRIYMMQQEYGSGFTAENTNHIAMYGEMGKAWKKFAEAESAANSGKYLTIEEVWDKVGKLPNFTKGGIDWMDQKSIQIMLSEPDPVKRKENIRNLGKWANEAGLKSFAKMYYNMYFEEELQAKKKSPDCIKLQQEALAKYDKEDHTKEIDAAMKSAHEAERTKFITYINQTRGFGSVGQDAANQKIFDDYDAKYESQDKAAIRTQIAAGMRQDVVDKVTKQALHADMMATENSDPNSASGVWKEAYGGTFNVVENINDKFFVTEDDVRMWATKWAIKIEALALATAMGMMTGGAAAAFAGEMGLAAGVFGTGAVNFIVDGAVMHSTLTALTEGDAGFRDPLAFGKGLAITYATMGLMKGTGALMGRSATLGKAAEGLAHATEGSVVGTAASAVGKMGGKAAFDAGLMTGFNMAVAAGGGKPMGWEDVKGTFAENFVICFVMGGMHGAIEKSVAGGPAKVEMLNLTPAERNTIRLVERAADADTAATKAREKANEALAKGNKNAPALELEATRLERAAKALDVDAQSAVERSKEKKEMNQKQESAKQKVDDLQAQVEAAKAEGKSDPKLEKKLKEAKAELKAADAVVSRYELAKTLAEQNPAMDPVLIEDILSKHPEFTASELAKRKPAEIRQLFEATKRTDRLQMDMEHMNPDQLRAYIEEYNKGNKPDLLRKQEFQVLRVTDEGVIMVDENGKLVETKINESNAKDVLKKMKGLDDTLRGQSYKLRNECLKRSGGSITSDEAYTYGEIPKGKAMDAYLDNPDNWLAERRQLHDLIIAGEFEKAQALSERLGDEEPTIYALRGNTAAGKTTRLRNDRDFAKTGDTSGAINPDTYKAQLRTADSAIDYSPTAFQTHEEGSMLARRLSRMVEGATPPLSEMSMVIDKRLNKTKNIDELIATAERLGRPVKIMDVDSPLETSCQRVLTRAIAGEDPAVPFGAVAEGYEGIRQNRAALIEQVKNNPAIKEYVLYVTDEAGKSVKVAEKKIGVFTILDQPLYERALDGSTQDSVNKVKATVIDDAYIQKADEYMRPFLERYRGKTLGEALDAHSKLTVEPHDEAFYMRTAMENLAKTSRTAQGVVDTSASADKAAKMAEGLTDAEAAKKAKENYQKMMQRLFTERGRSFNSPEDVRAFVESVGGGINQGITKEGVLIRSGEDSVKYPYTKVADLPKAMEQFYKEFYQRLNDPHQDPVALAAWVEYRVNLTDHIFADGCGKSSLALVSFVLMRNNLPLPQFESKGDTIQHSPKTIRGVDPAADARALRDLEATMRSRMAGKKGPTKKH